MKETPKIIESMQRTVAQLNNSIQNERERIDVIEADLTIDIHTAKGEDGKSLFGNDSLRKAAFIKRCAENSDLLVLTQSLQNLETDRLNYLAQIERRRLEFKLYLLDREEEINK